MFKPSEDGASHAVSIKRLERFGFELLSLDFVGPCHRTLKPNLRGKCFVSFAKKHARQNCAHLEPMISRTDDVYLMQNGEYNPIETNSDPQSNLVHTRFELVRLLGEECWF